jgi:hypothetical protein
MMMALLAFVSPLFFYRLASRRLERTIVTGPIVFTAAGLLMFPTFPLRPVKPLSRWEALTPHGEAACPSK